MKTNVLAVSVLLLIVVVLSACGSTATPQPDPTLTPTSVATDTPTASATPEQPTATPTETGTPLPTPTDQGDCINRAEFVSDVTVPDDTKLQAGEKFVKTWRIRNTGSCTWNMRYMLVYLKGDQMSAPYSTPLVETPPQETVDLSLEMVAPAQDGVFTGVFQFQGPSNHRFGVTDGNIWVRIVVGSGTPAPTTPTNTPQVPATSAPTGTPQLNSLTMTPTSGTPGGTLTTTPTGSAGNTGQMGSCKYTTNPDFDSQILILINQARAANGLPPYTLNSQLSSAALKHSIDMGCHNLLQHIGSDGSVPKDRVAAEGYSASSLQEAIYAQPPQYGGSPQSAVDWWLNDSVHRPILLSPKLTEIGVGYANVPTGTLVGYFTIEVATP